MGLYEQIRLVRDASGCRLMRAKVEVYTANELDLELSIEAAEQILAQRCVADLAPAEPVIDASFIRRAAVSVASARPRIALLSQIMGICSSTKCDAITARIAVYDANGLDPALTIEANEQILAQRARG